MAYVYKHVRLDKGEVFYIGIGSDNKGKFTRAFSKKGRSKFWKDLTKNIKYNVEILYDNITWKEACIKESELIKLYGRRDLGTGCLVNLTDGGEGINGYKHTEEELLNLSKHSKGCNNPNAKPCIHFDTLIKFDCLKQGCEYFNLKYKTQTNAIKRKHSTAQFYYENEYFKRPTKQEIGKKLGALRLGKNNHRHKNYKKIQNEKTKK